METYPIYLKAGSLFSLAEPFFPLLEVFFTADEPGLVFAYSVHDVAFDTHATVVPFLHFSKPVHVPNSSDQGLPFLFPVW